jgi:hypothetical protein
VIGILYANGNASTTCGNCRDLKTVSLVEIAGADGVFICPHCGEQEPLSPERLRYIAGILARRATGSVESSIVVVR